jgi:hypothetical protein
MIVRKALGHITPHSQLFRQLAVRARHLAARSAKQSHSRKRGSIEGRLALISANAVSGPEGSSVGIIGEQKQNRVHAGIKMGDNAFKNSEW